MLAFVWNYDVLGSVWPSIFGRDLEGEEEEGNKLPIIFFFFKNKAKKNEMLIWRSDFMVKQTFIFFTLTKREREQDCCMIIQNVVPRFVGVILWYILLNR